MTKLLTFLGTGRYEETEVIIDDYRTRQSVFPLALVEYFSKGKKEELEVVFFLTQQALKKYDELKVEEFCSSHNVPVKYEEISEDSKVVDFVKKMSQHITDGDEVILDVTHSFRMLPMLAIVISLYLRELKRINMRIFYGKYDSNSKTTTCTDITELSEMIDWIYATKLFIDYGYAGQISELLTRLNKKRYTDNVDSRKPTKLKTLSDDLSKVSEAIRLGSIQLIRESLRKFFKDVEDEKLRRDVVEFVPQLDLLFQRLTGSYKTFHVRNESLILNEEELKAEAELLKFYMQTGDYGMALRLAREYIKNVLLFKQGKADKFLDVSSRESLSVKQNVIFDARNHFAHFGFNNSSVSSDKIKKELEELVDKIEKNNLDEFFETIKPEKSLKAILTPLGTKPGALYTVLKHYHYADLLVILTSEQGEKQIEEILEKAEFRGEVKCLIMKDPYAGTNEVKDIVDKAKEYLKDAAEVIINLTGGTTFMTYVVERIRDEIRYGKAIRSVIAFDERTEEQKKEPYIIGKIVELEGRM